MLKNCTSLIRTTRLCPYSTVRFNQLSKPVRITLIVQVIGMLMGTLTHCAWIVNNGFLSQHYNAPLLSSIFWDSLTFLDPLAAFLLILRPKSGLILTACIICIDVVHNNIFYSQELYFSSIDLKSWITTYWMILGQIIFLLFVLLTLKRNWREVGKVSL